MDDVLRQLLDGQKLLTGELAAIKEQQKESNQLIGVLLHRTEELSAQFDALTHNVAGIEGKVNRIDDRVNSIDDRVNRLDDKVNRIDDKVNKIDDRVSKVEDKLDRIEIKVNQMDEQQNIMAADLSFLVRKAGEHDDAIRRLRRAE